MFARWDGWKSTGQGGGRRIELKPLGPARDLACRRKIVNAIKAINI